MRTFVLAFLVSGLAAPAAAQPPARPGESAAYYFIHGRHLESEGEIDEAIAAHRKAIELEPGSAELHAELAALYARQDRPREAVESAEAALQRDAKNREANRVLGSVYAALAEQRKALRPGDQPSEYATRAISYLEAARRDQAVDTGLELMLGRLYLQTRAYAQAVPTLERVVADQPGYPEAVWLLSLAYEGAGQTDRAVMALEDGPVFYRGRVRLAELHEREQRWKEAADAYAEAHAINPRGGELAPRHAAALLGSGKAAEARKILDEALAAKGNAEDPVLLYLLAASQRQLNDLAGAQATATRLRAIAPDDPRGMYVMAQILDARKDAAGAELALREMLARDPLDALALNYLGYMLAERGERLDEAVELVQRALRVDPENPSYLDSLGWAYFQQGRLDLADAPLSRAAEKLPSNSVVQDHLGDLRFKQQRFADAAAAWERSLAGDGESIDRGRIQQKLRDARTRVQ
jgi:tetratricopeptide (TPR) repeat protein